MRTNVYQFMKENNSKRLQYQVAFQQTFKVSLGEYWDIVTGFDIVRFDDEIVKSPDGTSTRDQLLKSYGEDAVKIVEGLL